MSNAPSRGRPRESRYGSGCGSPAGARERRAEGLQRFQRDHPGRDAWWRSSSPGTGPSGWYSQAWMSRADQSLSSTTPNTCVCGVRRCAIGSPERVAAADDEAELELVVQPAARAELRAPARRRPGLAPGPRNGVPLTRRSTRRGRGSRSAPTCSSAAAGCRGGTACPPSSRDGCRCRSRCSRRCAHGSAISASACGSRLARAGALVALPRASACDSAVRSCAAQRAERHQRVQLAAAAAVAGARRRSQSLPRGRRRSRIWSPIATPMRQRLVAALAPEAAEGQVLDREVGAGLRWPTRPSFAAPGRGSRSSVVMPWL